MKETVIVLGSRRYTDSVETAAVLDVLHEHIGFNNVLVPLELGAPSAVLGWAMNKEGVTVDIFHDADRFLGNDAAEPIVADLLHEVGGGFHGVLLFMPGHYWSNPEETLCPSTSAAAEAFDKAGLKIIRLDHWMIEGLLDKDRQ